MLAMKTSQLFDKPVNFLSAKQLAEHLNVSVKTVYGWVHNGTIVPERVGPRLIRFDKEKVVLWMASFRKEQPDGDY